MSAPIAFHIMFALVDRRVIFRTPAERVAAYNRLMRIAAPFGLLLVHLGSDHVHVVVACSPADVPRFAHAIECSWTHLLGDGPGFARYHAKAVMDQGHLRTLVRYILRQDEHHAQSLDPFHLGSNAPDLCGGRAGRGDLRARFAQFLPSIGRREIERIVLGETVRPVRKFGPAPSGLTGESLERHLRGAAASAVGMWDLVGKRRPVAEARAALLRLCRETELGRTVEHARVLRCHPNYVATVARRTPSRDINDAVSWQVAFRLQRIATRQAVE